MLKRLLLFFVLLLSFVPIAGFAVISSKDLLNYCTTYIQVRDNIYKGTPDNETGVETGICLAYIDGIINMDSLVGASTQSTDSKSNRGWALCLPDNITGNQAAEAVLKYLHNNPSEVNTESATMVVKALNDAYPCTTSK